MKPLDATPIQLITHDCSYMPQGCNVIFISNSSHLAVSTIAFASALAKHGIPSLYASYPGRWELLDLALGTENVIGLPIWAISPQSTHLGQLILRGREESAVLIIDAEVSPSFEFGRLPDAMNLLRGDTLSIAISLVCGGKEVPGMNTVWSCKSDRCVVHALGYDPSHQTGENFQELMELMPTRYGGEITNGMLNVLALSGPYQSLPAITELPSMFVWMPDHIWICQDHNVKALHPGARQRARRRVATDFRRIRLRNDVIPWTADRFRSPILERPGRFDPPIHPMWETHSLNLNYNQHEYTTI